MPYTKVFSSKSAAAAVEYNDKGHGKKRKQHIAEGTSRAVWHLNSFGDAEIFVRYCQLSKARRDGVECHIYIISWGADELDPADPRDWEAAGRFGQAFAEVAAEGHPYDVSVHVDGEGGKVHVHVVIANRSIEDETLISTKKQITKHSMVAKACDDLARERGMNVIGEPRRHGGWETERAHHVEAYEDEAASGKEPRANSLQVRSQVAIAIGDVLHGIYEEGGFGTFDEWVERCAEAGVRVEVKPDKQHGDVPGVVYHMKVPTDADARAKRGKGPRERKSKASFISSDFTVAGVEARIAELQAQAARGLSAQQVQQAVAAAEEERRRELEKRQEQVEREMRQAEERHVVPELAQRFEDAWDDGRYARVTRRDVERAVLAVDNEVAIMAKADAADPDLLWRLHEECMEVAHGEMPRAKRNAPHVDVEKHLAQEFDKQAKDELEAVRGMGYRHALRDAPASQKAFERLADRAAKLAEADAKVDNARGFVRSCVALAVYGWRVFQVARAREELLERLGQEGVVGSTTGDMPMFGELRDIVTNGVASWASGLGQQRQAGEAVAYEVDGSEAGVEREEREME